MRLTRFGLVLSLLAGGLGLALAPASAAAQNGTVSGQVTDKETGQGLQGARVQLAGTSLSALSAQDGRYTIRNVPAGSYEVRVVLVGFSAGRASVTLAAGGSVTADFALAAVPYSLEEVVTTATGEQRKLELGNNIASIKADEVVTVAQPQNLASLISGRAAGVQILQSSGTTGTGTRIRIRGANSLTYTNEPVIFVDGIRIESGAGSLAIGTGGQSPSRINDINPDEIEDIEIVKGPSAATLYGPQAANGVIIIKTKRGKAGKTRWNFFTEQGVSRDFRDYPDTYRQLTRGYNSFADVTSGASARKNICPLQDIASQAAINGISCVNTPLVLQVDNPINSESVYRTPRREQYGANVSGGSETAQYFISGEFENEGGVFTMPESEIDRVLRLSGRTSLREDELHPNNFRRVNLRSNITAQLAPTTTLQVNAGYLQSNLRLPNNDNSVLGIISSHFTGNGVRCEPVVNALNFSGTWNPTGSSVNLCGPASEATQYPQGRTRWGFQQPGETFQQIRNQRIQRVTGAMNLNTRFNSWLNGRVGAGVDYTQRDDRANQRWGEGPKFSNFATGFIDDIRTRIFQYTVDGALSATTRLNDAVGSRTTLGVQYLRDIFNQNYAGNLGMGPGVNNLNAGAQFFVGEATTENANLGLYLEQQFSIKDRLFLTGAIRRDEASALGGDVGGVYLPKASVSYVLSDMAGFPSAFSLFRLRGSFGEATVLPGPNDAIPFYTGITGTLTGGGDASGVLLSNFANPLLKPERAREFEAGLDIGLARDRVVLEGTYFNKKTRDAIIAVPTPASVGTPTTQIQNRGSVKNEGVEASIRAAILTGRTVSWDLTLAGSRTWNKVVALGPTEADTNPIIFNANDQRHAVGFTAGSYWDRRIRGWNDGQNNWGASCTGAALAAVRQDGIIAGCEVAMDTLFSEIGSSFPLSEVALNTFFRFFNNRVVVGGQVDYRGGHRLLNLTQDFRCRSSSNCLELYDNNTPESDRLRLAANRYLPNATFLSNAGYMEDGWFMRLRELSVTFNFPTQWSRALKSDNVSLTVTGRNLGLRDNYTGLDPEVNGQGQGNFAIRDFLTQPPIQYFSARLNVSF